MLLPPDLTLSKSGRLRRMSADAASMGPAPESLFPARTKGGSFSEAQTGKRSRTSAPDGLNPLGNDEEVDSLLDQRYHLYHLESKGRHQPRHRTSEGRTSPINTAPLDNETDFSEILSMLNESTDVHEKKGHADARAVISPVISPNKAFAQDPLALHSGLLPFSPAQQQQGKPPRPPGTRLQHHHQQHLLQHHHFKQAYAQQPQAQGHLASTPAVQQLELQPQQQLQMQLQQAFAGINGPACLSQGMLHAAPQQVKAPPPSPHDSSGTDTGGGSAQRTLSQRLSNSMRLNLRIHSDPALEEPLPPAFDPLQEQHERHSDTACGPSRTNAGSFMTGLEGEDNMGGAGSRVLQHSDSDSFNRTMNRVAEAEAHSTAP
ncbi:hypothetical protein DUNSADRAFT_2015 [Dunaliella salina]|uniref:Uncharacterized protein n=1 Tax=Dunaliella salina TaxID=3046 RepID=A0ABQ7FWR7_DUNSA|nr:hypothetical protein DUNSADRAFT_2015 [Dunaliella salina]|eukprot:KAF5826801.1 hypothetical protein DUNSADRAFT_2015 [Dunaliella salina]